jgi:HPt (histidine-containing phosphotransfer) domain-containing protein
MDSAPGSIDISNIVDVCRSGESLDRALLREMLGYFIHENQRRMATSLEAVEAGNREALRQLAHAVRGSAAMLGAGRLHDLAWSLELDAASSDIADLRRSVVALRSELETVVSNLYKAYPEARGD